MSGPIDKEGKIDRETNITPLPAIEEVGGKSPTGGSPSKRAEYKLYPYRWIICLFFCTQQMAYGICSSGFNPIVSIMSKIYAVDVQYVTSLAVVYSAIFLPINVIANKIIDTYGIALPIKIACVLGTAGAFLRLLATESFHYLFAGQCINAIGMPFVQALGASVAGSWFGDKERALVTTLTSTSIAFGSILGFALPSLFISDDDLDDYSAARDKVWQYILAQSIIIACLSIPNLIVARNHPPTAPSYSAHQVRDMKLAHQNMIENQIENPLKLKGYFDNLKIVASSWNYWFLNLSHAFIHSMFIAVGVVVSIITKGFGFSSTDNSFFGGCFIISGILFSIVHAIFLDRYQKFKFQTMFIGFTSCLFCGFLTFAMSTENFYITLFAVVGLGASTIPIIGIAAEFCAQITYPVNESIGCGLLQTTTCLLGTGYPYLIVFMIESYSKWWSFPLLGAGLLIGFIFSIFIKEEMLKNEDINEDSRLDPLQDKMEPFNSSMN